MSIAAQFGPVLRARRDYLASKLGKYEASLDRTPNPDWEDRATERENDEVIEGLGSAGLAELREIDAALHRIDEGSYGLCATCGEDISPERLKLVPHARLCRGCMAGAD